MTWDWLAVRRVIDESNGSFPAFLRRMPRSEIERLIWSTEHRCNVYGRFPGTNGDRAGEIYDEIARRATDPLKDEIASLRRERDDALLAADIVKDLATPPISDADVERMIAEAKRVRPQIEGEGNATS